MLSVRTPRSRAVVAFFVATWALLGFPTFLRAESGDYSIDVWNSDNDLPDSSVTSIAQTPDGYLWIGTYNGLARFDGVRFVTFDHVTTPELKHARIAGLFVDDWGTLWINTYDGSITSLRDGVFLHERVERQVLAMLSTADRILFTLSGHQTRIVSRDRPEQRQGTWSYLPLAGAATGNSFVKDGTGTIWYAVGENLYRIVGTNSEAVHPSNGWHGTGVDAMSVDDDGNLWVGTDQGIARWRDGSFEDQTPVSKDEPFIQVSSIYGVRDGAWVFGNGQVRKCVNRRWVAEVNAKEWRDLVGTFDLDLNTFQDRDGGLWLTHQGSGLFHINSDGRTEHLSTRNGLPSDLASCWFQDREGNIWVGLKSGGLVRLRKKQFQVISPKQGTTPLAVSSICDDGRSNVWIGTFSGGLYRWRNGDLERFNLPEGPYRDCFFSIYPDSQSRLWLSAGREDLFLLENARIAPFTPTVHGIKAILVDHSGTTWFGKPRGLTSVKDGAVREYPTADGLMQIRSLAEDPLGRLWIGTGEGNLFCHDNGTFTRFKAGDGQENRAIWSLLPEEDGTLWIGTFRGGLLRLKNGQFTRYTSQNGLPSDIISQILDDGQGRLWFGSHKGIFYLPKSAIRTFDAGMVASLPCVTYGLSEGLPALECSSNYQPTCWRGKDGRLWFSTVKGAVSILPEQLSVNHVPPPVVIEELLVSGKAHPDIRSEPPSLPPGKHQLDFRYTALSFLAPDKINFRYRLEGVDEDWVDGGTKRSAHYGSLRPGRYLFRVTACNSDGIWNDQGAALSFAIRPYFWQTWWFHSLLATAALGSAFGTVRFVATRKLHKKLAQLEQQQALERERERIAKDIHDDLGAGLTRIMLQTALAQRKPQDQIPAHLAQISSTAYDLVGAMDEIVWAIDPENDTLDGLVTYAGKFVQEFVAQAGLRCRLDLPAQVPSITVSAQERHNLFLAAKESLNNILKYARATEVCFELKLRPDGFSFLIRDNGIGFEPELARSGSSTASQNRISSGHGLRNLAERMEQIGATCAIRSQPGTGTEVELAVKASKPKQPDPSSR